MPFFITCARVRYARTRNGLQRLLVHATVEKRGDTSRQPIKWNNADAGEWCSGVAGPGVDKRTLARGLGFGGRLIGGPDPLGQCLQTAGALL